MSQIVQIIMYHYIRELPYTRYPQIKGLLLSQFELQLRFLKESGKHFVSVAQVLEAAHGGTPLPQDSVLLTFDDGYLDHYINVFPLLDSMNIPAFFSMPGKIIAEKRLLDVNRIHFILASRPVEELVQMSFDYLDQYRGQEFPIPSDQELYDKLAIPSRFDDADTIYLKRLLQVELPERLRELVTAQMFDRCIGVSEENFVGELYMTLEQAKTMNRHGMSWGIHGYDHYWMNRLTTEALQKDIVAALEVFEGVVPHDRWMCCYPYGSVSSEVISCVQSLGAVGGFTTEVRTADLYTDSIYALPRWDTNDFPPKSERYLKK